MMARPKKSKNIEKDDKLMSIDGSSIQIKKITQKYGKIYEITPIKGHTYTVPENHILILKATFGGMITHNKQNNQYRVVWLENFKFKTKSFGISIHGKEKTYDLAKNFYA